MSVIDTEEVLSLHVCTGCLLFSHFIQYYILCIYCIYKCLYMCMCAPPTLNLLCVCVCAAASMFSCSTSTASGHSHLCLLPTPSSFHIHTNTHTPLLFSVDPPPPPAATTAIYLIYGPGECVTHTHVCIIYHTCERTVCERMSVWYNV